MRSQNSNNQTAWDKFPDSVKPRSYDVEEEYFLQTTIPQICRLERKRLSEEIIDHQNEMAKRVMVGGSVGVLHTQILEDYRKIISSIIDDMTGSASFPSDCIFSMKTIYSVRKLIVKELWEIFPNIMIENDNYDWVDLNECTYISTIKNTSWQGRIRIDIQKR